MAGVTKLDPSGPDLSVETLRDQLATLFFGDQGLTAGPGTRVALYALVTAAAMVSAVMLRRRSRAGFWLLAGTGFGVLALHAVVTVIGPDVLEANYLTAMIPLAAAVLAVGVTAIPHPAGIPVAVVALLATGGFVFVNRFDREVNPDYERVARLVERERPSAVLTNSAVILYYVEDPRPLLDKPFGFGRNFEPLCRVGCPRPYAVVEDRRSSPLRPGTGARRRVGQIVIRLVR
jgi:hypothetical protein